MIMEKPETRQVAHPPDDDERSTHAAPGISRGWLELIGIVSLSVSVAALAFVSGVAPILEMSREALLGTVARLIVIIFIGAALLVIALRQEGRKWSAVAVVPLIIAAISLIVVFVPLWGYFSYLQATNPMEYFRLFR
jgi:uncharacterized membrane protein YozB (DUF420 family)